MPNSRRFFLALLLSIVLIAPALLAFNSPLSDEAIREAYFLGQRRDETTTNFLEKYKQLLPMPDSGPQIAAVEFLTPFALMVLGSKERSIGYSAQQAELDHRRHEERVVIRVEVRFTASYGALIQKPTGGRSSSPMGFEFRGADFWKDIDVQVIEKDRIIKPSKFRGEPVYSLGEGRDLAGATLRLELPAGVFDSDSVTVHVVPPEGPDVWVDFDLTALR